MSIKEDVSNLLIKFGLKDSDIIEAKKPEVKAVEFDREKFEDVALLDGTMIMVEPAVEAGAAVVVMNADIPEKMPIGEYELEDGKIIVIEEVGVIAAVNEPAAVDVDAKDDLELAEDDKAKEAKRIIESIVTEKVFKAVAKFNKQVEELTDALSNEKKEKVDFMSEVAAILEKLGEQPAKKPIVAKQKSFGQEKSKNIFHKDLKNK